MRRPAPVSRTLLESMSLGSKCVSGSRSSEFSCCRCSMADMDVVTTFSAARAVSMASRNRDGGLFLAMADYLTYPDGARRQQRPPVQKPEKACDPESADG